MSYDFDAIASAFIDAGVRHAFGVTGSGASLRLIQALQQQGVGYYPAIHEAAAGLMAGAACHDGRSHAMAITIKGPGFANLAPALLSNFYEGRPALSVSEAYGPDANPWQAHKRLDHEALCGALVKARTGMDPTGANVASLANTAQTERPGPGHLDLAATPADPDANVATTVTSATSGNLDTACEAIRKSRRPLVVLGSWAGRMSNPLDWNALTVPMVTTAAAKGVVDETGSFSAGVITGEAGRLAPESHLIPAADLVIAFGLRNQEVVKAAPLHCPLIAVDALPMEAPQGFKPDHQITNPSTEDLQQLWAVLTEFDWGGDHIQSWRDQIQAEVLPDPSQAGPMYRLIQDTLTGRGLDPRLVLDTGFFCTVGETVWRCRRPGDYVGSAVGRYMGTSIPTAIGLAITDRSRPVVCAAGDGGIGGAFAELRMAQREQLPLLVLCLSDGGYGSVAAFAGAEPSVQRATEFPDTDWCRLAQGLGIDAAEIAGPDQLSDRLTTWVPSKGPLFLQIAFDPGPYRDIARLLR